MTVADRIDSYANPREAEDRRRALKHIAVGGLITGSAAAAEYGLDRRLKAKGAKGPLVSAVKRTFKPKTHGPHIAGRLATRALSATGLPVMAYGLWNIANPKAEVEDLDFTRHVVRPAMDHVTLRDQRNKLKSLRKSLTIDEQDTLVRRKEHGTRISHAAGGLGVAALALRVPQAAKFAAGRSARAGSLRGVARAAGLEPKATALSNTLGVASIGTGSIGSFNYAAQQALEAKQVKKSLYDGMVKGIGRVRVVERSKPGYVTVYDSKDVRRFMPESRVTPVPKRKAAADTPPPAPSHEQMTLFKGLPSIARGPAYRKLTDPKAKEYLRQRMSVYDRGRDDAAQISEMRNGYQTSGRRSQRWAGGYRRKRRVNIRPIDDAPLETGPKRGWDGAESMPPKLVQRKVTRLETEYADGSRSVTNMEEGKPTYHIRSKIGKRDDRFLREHRDRISPKAEAGYTYLKDGRNQRRGSSAVSAAVSGMSGAMAYSAARGRRFGWAGGHGAIAGLSGMSAVSSAREAGRWDARMGKIKAKAMERAAAGEYGRDRMVAKADERRKDDKRGAFAAGAGLGAAVIAGVPLPMRLPINREASRGIAGRLDGADSGRVSVRDVRGVATGEGTRWAASRNQDRLAASMADRREAGRPAQDPGRPVRLRRAPDGSMRVIDGHHRIKALMDLGEKDVDVKVEHSGRPHRTWVPLAQRAKYLRDVGNAREFTGQRDLGEIRANAARPIPRAARVGNRVRSRAERGVLALRRPAGVTGLAAAAGLATGGMVAHRMANRKKVEKSFTYDSKGRPNGSAPVSQMSAEQRGSLREQVERMARTRKEKGAKFPGLKPLVERGVRAKRPETSRAEQSAKYRATRIERRHGEALAENASRSANALKRRSLVAPSQLGKWGAGLAIAGGGAAMLAARSNDKDRSGGRAADAVIAAGAGLGAREAAMGAGGWATKRGIERYRERKLRNPEAKAAYNRDWKAFQEREGFKQFGVRHPGDRIDMTNHDTQVRVGRRYPTSIPGGRAARALAFKNSRQVSWGSKVAVPLAAASLALSGNRDGVGKALVPRMPRLGGGVARPAIRRSYVGTSPLGRKFTVRGTVR